MTAALIEAHGVDSAEYDRVFGYDDAELAADSFLSSRREPPFYRDFTSHGFIRFTEGHEPDRVDDHAITTH